MDAQSNFDALGDANGVAHSLEDIGNTLQSQGHLEGAKTHTSEAKLKHELFKNLGSVACCLFLLR